MDKLMDNRWFMKAIALALAMLLYSAVPDNDRKPADHAVTGDENTETIQGVPVSAYYDTENLVVSGVPNTVDVIVQGSLANVQTAKALRNFEVYVDLAEIKIGSHTVPIKIKNINTNLKVQIDPAYANITVQERVTKSFKVEAEFDEALLEDGYVADRPVVEPSTVKITGAKDKIERITYVKATLDLNEVITETITKEAKVRVLDSELNKLEVVVEPDTVEVTIPVTSGKKTVPINILQKGSLPNGVTLESIDLNVKEAAIIGPQELLDKTESVRVEVDLSQISGDTELTLPVIISEGITKVNPQLVEAKIDVTKVEERTLSNLPIIGEGLSDTYSLEFRNPADGLTSLTIFGPSDEIKKIDVNEFALFIDLSNVGTGTHEIEIQVDGPESIGWRLERTVALVDITEKES
jgi:YbbR domain-containing protein